MMKKLFLQSLFVVAGVLATVAAQAQCLSVNSPSVTCTVPCATLTASSSLPPLAQTNTYSVSSIPYAPQSFTAGTNAFVTLRDDYYSPLVPIGFTFCYFGASYTQVCVGANGQVNFRAGQANSAVTYIINTQLPNTSDATRGCIMGTHHDMDPTVAGTIRYITVGTAPCRKFIVSWNNVGMYSCTSQRATQQIILYEATNEIEVYIANKPRCTGWNGGYAQTGIENLAGTVAFVAPGENSPPTWPAVTNEGWRFSPAGAVTPWTYTWTGPGGAVVGTTPSISVCPTVTTTYNLTMTNTACASFTASASGTVTVGNLLAPITGPTALCKGNTAMLSDPVPSGTWTSGSPAVVAVSPTGQVTGLSAGTATISYGSTGCYAYHTITVTDPVVTPSAPICPGGTTSMTGSPAGGTWSSSNAGVAIINATSGVVNGVAPGTTNIVYTAGPGCTATTTLSVVAQSPITGDTIICQNTATTLSNTTTGGTWSTGNPAIATINIYTGVVTGISPGDAPVTYSLGGGCLVYSSVHVDPVLPITGVATLCQRGTTTLSNAIAGGVWTIAPATIAVIDPVTGVVSGVTPGPAGAATATYVSPYGCVSTLPVIVRPTPANPVAAPPFRYCQFEYADPLGIQGGVAGSIYTWYGLGVTPGTTTSPTPNTSVAGIDTFYVTQTSSYGCVGDSTMVTIRTYPRPAAPVTTDKQYCELYESPTPLDQQVTATGTLNWYNSSGAPLGTATPPVPTEVVTYPNGTTWYVSQTIDQCEGDSTPVKVTIVNIPDFHIATRPWVCQYDSMQLAFYNEGAALVNGGFHWILPNGASFTQGTSDTDEVVHVQFDSARQDNYVILTADNLNGQCFSSDTARIKVVEQPSAAGKTKTKVCMSDTATLALSARSSGAADFAWTINGVPLFSSDVAVVVSANSNHGGPFELRWIKAGIHFINMQAFTVEGCQSNPVADTVEVRALPDASFTYETPTGTLCIEDSVLFVANDSEYQNIYLWAPEHSFKGLDKRSSWGRVEQAQSLITLTVTDPFGCVATESKTLNPEACCIVPFPNAFTPNGDGLNDVFRPVPLKAFHRYHIFRVTNRWGQVVFTSTDNKASWDGTINGVPQDIGVYYYYLKYDCDGKTLEQKGDVTIIR